MDHDQLEGRLSFTDFCILGPLSVVALKEHQVLAQLTGQTPAWRPSVVLGWGWGFSFSLPKHFSSSLFGVLMLDFECFIFFLRKEMCLITVSPVLSHGTRHFDA